MANVKEKTILALSTKGLPMCDNMTMPQQIQINAKGSSQYLRQRHKRNGKGLSGMMSQLKLVLGSAENTIK